MQIKKHHLGLILWGSFFLAFSSFQQFSIKESSDFEAEEESTAKFQWEQMRDADPATGVIPQQARLRSLVFSQNIPNTNGLYGGLSKKMSDWYSLGPGNVGGRTRSIAIDVKNEQIMLAGSVTGGIWRSTDQGKSWNKTSSVQTIQSITCITQDTRAGKENIWYAGTGERIGGHVVSGDGIYKSIDSGKSWTQLWAQNKPQSTQASDYIWNIVVNTANTSQDEIFIAAYSGIFRSTDGGQTITVSIKGSSGLGENSDATDVAITSKGVVYATLSSNGPSAARGIWRMASGSSWTRITPSGFPPTYNRIKIGIAQSNENIVYFLTSTNGYGFKGIGYENREDWNCFHKYSYLSGDGSGTGSSWEDRSSNLPDYNQKFGYLLGDFNTQGGYDMVVRTYPTDENIVFLGGTNVYRSDDGFASRTKTSWIGGYNRAKKITDYYTYTNHHSDQHNLIFLPSNSKVAISTHDGGISRTENCLDSMAQWKYLNSGYITTQFYTITLNQDPKYSHQFSDIVLGGLQDNNSYFTSTKSKGISNWTNWHRGDGGYCALADDDSGTSMYVSIQQGRIYKFRFDQNGKQLGFGRIDPKGGSNALFINPFVLDAADKTVLYHISSGIIYRNDSLPYVPLEDIKNNPISTGWQSLTNATADFSQITSLHSANDGNNTLYYGSSNGHVYKLSHANTGQPNKTDISTTKMVGYVNCITSNPDKPLELMAVLSNYNVRSLFYYDGASWTDVSGNLEEKTTSGLGNGPACRWAKAVKQKDGSLNWLVGTSTGLYRTTELNGNSTVWTRESENGIGNMDVEMIDFRPKDGYLAAATYGNGVYYANTDESVGLTEAKIPFTGFKAYPNPISAGEVLTLEMNVLKANALSINIYSMDGKLIKTLVQRLQNTGSQQISVMTDELKSGSYFIKINSGSYSQTAKFLKL